MGCLAGVAGRLRRSAGVEVRQIDRLAGERVGAVTEELDAPVRHEAVAGRNAGRLAAGIDQDRRRERRLLGVAVVAPARAGAVADVDHVILATARAPEHEPAAFDAAEDVGKSSHEDLQIKKPPGGMPGALLINFNGVWGQIPLVLENFTDRCVAKGC